jgi:GxxExxY protein
LAQIQSAALDRHAAIQGVKISTYKADLIVEDSVIVEIKAVSTLIDRHAAQAMHYLTATRRKLAILINFGAESLQTRRIVR